MQPMHCSVCGKRLVERYGPQRGYDIYTGKTVPREKYLGCPGTSLWTAHDDYVLLPISQRWLPTTSY